MSTDSPMNPFTAYQEGVLREQAEEDRAYAQLLFFYAALRELDKLDALATNLDPKNQTDMLAFELFQGTEPAALVPLCNADTPSWIRHALLKAFLHAGAADEALGFWRKLLQWRTPDTLCANVLLQFLLREGMFEHAADVAAVSLQLSDKQRDVLSWKAMAQSRQALNIDLYLDPMPLKQEVTFAVTTREATPYLERTLAGIAVQSYPIAGLIVVEEEIGVLAKIDAAGCPFSVVPCAPGNSWIAAAAAAAKTPLMLTLPPDCAPAEDFAQQCMIAIESGAEYPGCTGGRVEAFFQDKPGDRWRVMRMSPEAPMQRLTTAEAITTAALCLDRAAVASLGGDTPTVPNALAKALKAAGRHAVYLPEAVACCLREDTIESALDEYWQSRLAVRLRSGEFASAECLIQSFRVLKERMVEFVNDDIDQGNTSLVFPDFFLFYHNALLDLQYGRQKGVLEDGTARVVQDALFDAITPMDQAFKRDLRGKVTKMLGHRMITAPPATVIDAGAASALHEVLDNLDTLFAAFPQDLYLAIYG